LILRRNRERCGSETIQNAFNCDRPRDNRVPRQPRGRVVQARLQVAAVEAREALDLRNPGELRNSADLRNPGWMEGGMKVEDS